MPIIYTNQKWDLLTESAQKLLAEIIKDFPEDKLIQLAETLGYEDTAYFVADDLKRFGEKISRSDRELESE